MGTLVSGAAGRGTGIEKNLGEVLRAGDRVNIVRQILTYSRYTEQNLKPIQVKNVVNKVLKLIRSSLPSTIEIRKNILSDSIILADTVLTFFLEERLWNMLEDEIKKW